MIPSDPEYTPEVTRTGSPSTKWAVFIPTSYPALLGPGKSSTQFDFTNYLCSGQDPLDLAVLPVPPQNFLLKTLALVAGPA